MATVVCCALVVCFCPWPDVIQLHCVCVCVCVIEMRGERDGEMDKSEKISK